MKINNSIYLNHNNVKLQVFKPLNPSFKQEDASINSLPNENAYIKIYIYGKPYFFKSTEETKDAKILDSMIENIKKTITGHFVRHGYHEYYIPHVLRTTPDILDQLHIVEEGNAETEINEESQNALKIIQSYAKEKLDIAEMKTIKFIIRPFKGYVNNTLEKAFSYYDNINDELFLYIPHKKKLQILNNSNLVRNIRF